MANEKDIKNVKNLTITELKKKNKELDSQTEHEIKIGEDVYKIKIDDVFRQTKQHKVLDDLIDFFNEGNSRIELLDLATPYTTLLMIKHFTSLEVSDDIDKALDLLEVLIDLDILGQIVNLMPESEVTKMYEVLSATVNRMNENLTELEEEAKSLSQMVENPELKEMLENGKK